MDAGEEALSLSVTLEVFDMPLSSIENTSSCQSSFFVFVFPLFFTSRSTVSVVTGQEASGFWRFISDYMKVLLTRSRR